LSAGTALASSRKPLCGVFGHALFPQESPPSTHPDWSRYLRNTSFSSSIVLLANAIPAARIHVVSCGRTGIDETPQCCKHEEAQQSHAESVVYTGCVRIGNLFHSYRHKSDIDRSYVAVYINCEN